MPSVPYGIPSFSLVLRVSSSHTAAGEENICNLYPGDYQSQSWLPRFQRGFTWQKVEAKVLCLRVPVGLKIVVLAWQQVGHQGEKTLMGLVERWVYY
jgi:hypothetical protein